MICLLLLSRRDRDKMILSTDGRVVIVDTQRLAAIDHV